MDEPTISFRQEQPYVGMRVVLPMRAFSDAIPALIADVSRWLERVGGTPAGPPFLRYHVIAMPERMDVELGIPVPQSLTGDGQVNGGLLPGGRYATLTYDGDGDGVDANARLIDWIGAQGERMACHASPHGDVFEARYEVFLTEGTAGPDTRRRRTEVAIKLRE